MIFRGVFSCAETPERVGVTLPDGIFDPVKDEPQFKEVVDLFIRFHCILQDMVVYRKSSVAARRTCSGVTVMHCSFAAAIRAPLAR